MGWTSGGNCVVQFHSGSQSSSSGKYSGLFDRSLFVDKTLFLVRYLEEGSGVRRQAGRSAVLGQYGADETPLHPRWINYGGTWQFASEPGHAPITAPSQRRGQDQLHPYYYQAVGTECIDIESPRICMTQDFGTPGHFLESLHMRFSPQ